MDYLGAMMAFEVWATARFKGAKEGDGFAAALVEIQQRYDALLEKYCAPNILKQRLRSHFGDPPTADPAKTRVESVSRTGKRIVVMTLEDLDPLPPLEPKPYEYSLERVGGELRIADRRTRDWDGRWIRYIV